jgi:hypothetical protein
MSDISYESIEGIIQDVEVTGSQVRCIFMHLDGATINSSSSIPKDNTTMGRVGNTVKRQLINRARSQASQSIFSLLGGGILGRTGSMIIRSSVNNNSTYRDEPDEEDIHAAVIKAFEKISNKYIYDEASHTWAPALPQKQKMVIRSKEEITPGNTRNHSSTPTAEKSSTPGLNRLEKEVLARLIVEICDADGTLSPEEENVLRTMLPKELGPIDKIRQMDFISPLEIQSLSMDAKQTILKCAYLLSYSDFQPHENETAIIHEYGHQMGLNIAQLKQIEKEAKLEALSAAIDEHTSRSEVFDIAAQINIPNDEAEMMLIQLKSTIR